MSLLKKKPDPISERERVLNARIAALQAEINELGAHAESATRPPKLRSTARPHAPTATHTAVLTEPSPTPAAPAHEPIFEEDGQAQLKNPVEAPAAPQLYNELGVRKYDLPGFVERIKRKFRGPGSSNPRLIALLAAGGVQGLRRSLRKERRVARNRFLLLVGFLFIILLGLFSWFLRNR
jgi:hypothetical protein